MSSIYYFSNRYHIFFRKRILFKLCLNCSNKIPVHKKRNVFCNQKCYFTYYIKKRIQDCVDNSEIDFFNCNPRSEILLNTLKNIRGNMCQWCDTSHWQGKPIKLSIYKTAKIAPMLLCSNCKTFINTINKTDEHDYD